jgi:hypothetical protein
LVSYNCTDSVDITVTQNILEGATIPVAPGGNTTIILTAFDEAGNSAQCSFTLNIIDDIDPAFTTCPGNQTAYVNSSCNAILGNYATLAAATDNCAGAVTITQSPVAGTSTVSYTHLRAHETG